jgi:hypothetical protein
MTDSSDGRRTTLSWSFVGAVACLVALGALIWQTTTTSPANLWILAAMLVLALVIEGAYRRARRRHRVDA